MKQLIVVHAAEFKRIQDVPTYLSIELQLFQCITSCEIVLRSLCSKPPMQPYLGLPLKHLAIYLLLYTKYMVQQLPPGKGL